MRHSVRPADGAVLAVLVVLSGCGPAESLHSTAAASGKPGTSARASTSEVIGSPSGAEAVPFPESIRIPIAVLRGIFGTVVVPAVASPSPAESVVTQQVAEAAAIGALGAGTTVIGTLLANVADPQLGRPARLFWIVSVDPGQGSGVRTQHNFMDAFVDATSGAYDYSLSATDPLLPAWPGGETGTGEPPHGLPLP